MQDYKISIKGDRFWVLGKNIKESIIVANLHHKVIIKQRKAVPIIGLQMLESNN